MSASCTKTPIYRQIQKSIQIHFSRQIANCFSFFCFVLRRTSNVHFWYMHLTLNCWFINICIWNERLITGDIRNRGNVKLSDAVWLLCPPRYQGRFDWRMWPNHLNSPQSKTRFSNTFPKQSWFPISPGKAQYSPSKSAILSKQDQSIVSLKEVGYPQKISTIPRKV